MDFEEGACKQVSRKDLTEGTVIPSIFNTFFFFFYICGWQGQWYHAFKWTTCGSWFLTPSLALGSEQVVRVGSAAGVFTQVFTEPLNMASGVPHFCPSSGRSHEVATQDFLQGGQGKGTCCCFHRRVLLAGLLQKGLRC